MVRAARLHPRVLVLGAAALVLLLVAALLLPRHEPRPGALRPSAAAESAGLRYATAGASAVTADAAAEIDRVVQQSAVSARRVDARSTPGALAAAQIRCAEFEGQRYCLRTGWTDRTQEEVVRSSTRSVQRQAARPRTVARGTGDATLLSTLRRDARRTPAQQAAADRAELTQAARAVGKVWLLRHQIQGRPLPAGFLAAHPEVVLRAKPPRYVARTWPQPKASPAPAPTPTPTPTPTPSPSPTPSSAATPTTPTTPTPATTAAALAAPTHVASTVTPPASVDPETKPASAYPRKRTVLDTADVADQTRTYWCGPTAMQMVAWGWNHRADSQDTWAARLGTTRSGTSISAMVAVTNAYTGWDGPTYAGPYVALDVSDFTYRQWWKLIMRHVVDYRSPVILHPVLLKQFYPYLDDDASGHFQVGRGYDKRGAKANHISFFEPWNQQRFDPSEPYIDRVQWRSAYKSYRANLAHFQHNIGV